MINLGTVKPGSTIYIPFETFSSSTGAPITLTGLATSDILIYKDGGATARASTSGFTLLDTDGIDFAGITGIHGISINLADNTTADFYAAGSRYFVVISSVTVDSQTMSFLAGSFEIGYPQAILNTTIATLSSQTSFTLISGPAEDDALNGMWGVVHDAASAVQSAKFIVSDYTGSTKTVTLSAAPTFTIAAKDNFSLIGPSPATQTTVDTAVTDIATILTRLGTPSNLGGGATVAANLSDIESQTDDIGVAGAGLTNMPLPTGIVENSMTFVQILRILAAHAAGKTTITPSSSTDAVIVFRDLADTKDRITSDMSGSERTTITLDAS